MLTIITFCIIGVLSFANHNRIFPLTPKKCVDIVEGRFIHYNHTEYVDKILNFIGNMKDSNNITQHCYHMSIFPKWYIKQCSIADRINITSCMKIVEQQRQNNQETIFGIEKTHPLDIFISGNLYSYARVKSNNMTALCHDLENFINHMGGEIIISKEDKEITIDVGGNIIKINDNWMSKNSCMSRCKKNIIKYDEDSYSLRGRRGSEEIPFKNYKRCKYQPGCNLETLNKFNISEETRIKMGCENLCF